MKIIRICTAVTLALALAGCDEKITTAQANGNPTCPDKVALTTSSGNIYTFSKYWPFFPVSSRPCAPAEKFVGLAVVHFQGMATGKSIWVKHPDAGDLLVRQTFTASAN